MVDSSSIVIPGQNAYHSKATSPGGCFLATCCLNLAAANVKKTIFVPPSLQPVSAESLAIDDLGLECLCPGNSMLRTNLNASFLTHAHPYGTEAWLYLKDLNPGQRHKCEYAGRQQ